MLAAAFFFAWWRLASLSVWTGHEASMRNPARISEEPSVSPAWTCLWVNITVSTPSWVQDPVHLLEASEHLVLVVSGRQGIRPLPHRLEASRIHHGLVFLIREFGSEQFGELIAECSLHPDEKKFEHSAYITLS